jgi:hypothetical protein
MNKFILIVSYYLSLIFPCSKHKCIKEIIIDKGHRVEVISRKRLLKDDQILQLFRCRVKAVNRSN